MKPQHLNSHGTAMSNTLRQISGSIGTSLITTIYTNRTDPFFMNSLQAAVSNVVHHMGINDAYMWVTLFCAAGVILSLFLRALQKFKQPKPLVKEDEQGK